MQTHVIANLFERSGVDKRSDTVNPRPQPSFCQTSGYPNKVLLGNTSIQEIEANLPKVAGLYERAAKPEQRFPVAPPLKAIRIEDRM